jgi:hypothetical protein
VTKAAKPKQDELVSVELNPASGVDVLGDDPILWVGMRRDVTRAEAEGLLGLRNSHGTPICRIYVGD